ncbi:MAG: segregation/condensation protein A [Bacilli bacterium]
MNHKFIVDDFEGPLDLLLHLIKEKKQDIYNIKLEVIIDQYLEFIKSWEKLDLDIASSYLVVAAELIEIKSKKLLPKVEEEIEDEEDVETKLINKLIEYQKYKEITKNFKDLEYIRKEIHTKLPENINEFKEKEEIVSDMTIDNLVMAYSMFLKRLEEDKPLPTTITSKEISLSQRKKEITSLLKINKRIEFYQLFTIRSKNYLVITFLTILEMAKLKEIVIVQENNFEKIYCEVVL